MIDYIFPGVIVCTIGFIIKFFPPAKINDGYGYRSARAKKNQETWDYANRLFSNLCLLSGCSTLILGFLGFFSGWGAGRSVTILVGILEFLAIVTFVEFKLKKRDD